eukprot:4184054-Alexandrium_andersonii.AAC.1
MKELRMIRKGAGRPFVENVTAKRNTTFPGRALFCYSSPRSPRGRPGPLNSFVLTITPAAPPLPGPNIANLY